jgi:tryptophan-rich sensory protein
LVIDFPDGVPWLTLMGHAALYGIMGLAVAQVIHARGAQNRSAAIYAFVVLLALWQLWPVVALTGSQLGTSALVGATLLVALVTVTLFGRIRTIGALLLLPATVWLAVAAYRAFHPL